MSINLLLHKDRDELTHTLCSRFISAATLVSTHNVANGNPSKGGRFDNGPNHARVSPV